VNPASDPPGANEPGLPEPNGKDQPLREANAAMSGEPVSPPQEATVPFISGVEAQAEEFAESSLMPEGFADPLLIGEYRIIARLGSGGMAEVYCGWHAPMQRRVALKLLRRRPDVRTAGADVLAEVQATARLQHPNIVQLYHVLEYQDRLCLVLEFVEGRTLSQSLAQGAALDFTAIARLMLTLAQAVQYAHDAGVLHLDLKPGNVLLTANGQPKIADFGLSRRIGRLSQGAYLAGTPCYMAPEQTWTDGELGVWTDVYGLGTILYQLLTGQPPVADGSLAQVFTAVRSGAILPIGQLQPLAPPALVAICQKCLQPLPRDRYSSAAALASDLQRFLAGEAVRVPVRQTAYRLRLWCRHPMRIRDAGSLMTAFSTVLGCWCLLGLLLLVTGVLEVPQPTILIRHILVWLCGGYLPGLALGLFTLLHRPWAIYAGAGLAGLGVLVMLGHLAGVISPEYTMGGMVAHPDVLRVENLLITCLFGLAFLVHLPALYAWHCLYRSGQR